MSNYRTTELDSIEVIADEVGKVRRLIIDDHSLAFHIGISGKTLWYTILHIDQQYSMFERPKATGGVRTIHNPSPLMRVIGEQLRRKILNEPCRALGEHVTAYREGRSTVDAARRHLVDCALCAPADGAHTCDLQEDGAGHLRRTNTATCAACQPVPKHACPRKGVKVHLDLSDFFGSTRRAWIRQYFHREIGYSHKVSSLLAQLMTVTLKGADEGTTYRGVPQGGKPSGDITNLVADVRLDRPLLQALPQGWTYSRYADDLYFSNPNNVPRDEVNALLDKVRTVIRKSGYRVNEKKTRIQRPHTQQKLLGVVLNQRLNMPKDEYRRFRAMLHQCWCVGFEPVATRMKKSCGGELQGWIEGKLAYFTAIAPERARELKRRYAMAQAKFPLGSEVPVSFGGTTP